MLSTLPEQLFCSGSCMLSYVDVCVVFECLYVAQGQKGEPGVILGPDGTPMHLGGLAGQLVKNLMNR